MRFILKKRHDFGFKKCKTCGIQVSVDTAQHYNCKVRKDGKPSLAMTLCTECSNASRNRYTKRVRPRRDWNV